MFLLLVLSLAVYVSNAVEVESLVGYHERIAIPAASRIKAAEDAYFANENPSSRIVGGDAAQPNSHPYLGGLLITYKNHANTGVCGSSLISPSRLVTAAHCWFDGRFQANRFVVVIGSHFLFYGGQRIATSTIATHPRWNPSTLQNDIAVIYLQNPVSLSDSIQPIALPSNLDESFVGDWAVASGFGRTADEQTSVSVMSVVSEVSLQVISVEACQAVYGGFVGAAHVCTSGAGGVGICGGDAGGPLAVNQDGRKILIGVSSFVSSSGCERGFPSGFTRVSSYMDFLTLHLQ